MKKNKSFMKILKRRGPTVDPCGTVVSISPVSIVTLKAAAVNSGS